MPSKDDLHYTSDERSTTQDFLARDVDELVAEIKENLRLRARPCHSFCKQRATPYRVPAPRTQDSKCHSCGSPRCSRTCIKKPRTDSADPYEVLQILLEEGSLIKEAVKRLQTESTNPTTTKNRKLFYDDCDSHSPLLSLDLNM